jgi:hypothetical protein
MALSQYFKPFERQIFRWPFIFLKSFMCLTYFCSCFFKFKTKLDVQSLLHASKEEHNFCAGPAMLEVIEL